MIKSIKKKANQSVNKKRAAKVEAKKEKIRKKTKKGKKTNLWNPLKLILVVENLKYNNSNNYNHQKLEKTVKVEIITTITKKDSDLNPKAGVDLWKKILTRREKKIKIRKGKKKKKEIKKRKKIGEIKNEIIYSSS